MYVFLNVCRLTFTKGQKYRIKQDQSFEIFPFISFPPKFEISTDHIQHNGFFQNVSKCFCKNTFLLQIQVTQLKYKERFILDKNVLFILVLKILLNDF